jgi:hypothetical protein
MKYASTHRHSFHIYICLLSTSIHKERSLSVSRRLPQLTVEKNVLEFLNYLKFILYLKYDNFSTTWCMTRLPLLPIIDVRAHYIIQLEIHNNTSYLSGNNDAAVNKKNNKITCKKYTRFFLVLSVLNINISDDKVHNLVVNIVDLNEFISYCYKYNQRFQVYFRIFRLTNQSAPSYSLLRRYCRKNMRCFCVFQIGLYNEL